MIGDIFKETKGETMIPANYYQKEQSACKAFLGEVAAARHRMERPNQLILPLISLLSTAIIGHIKTGRLIRNIRRVMNSCDIECADTRCLDMFCETAKAIRDNYAGIHARIADQKFLHLLLNGLVEKSLDDWDELVTDCVIGSDPEFKSMILQIAEKADAFRMPA
jgi:hypothetical protein